MKINRERLEALQRRAGLTGEALAARAGITPPMLSRLKGRGSCSKTTAQKLATVVGYDFIAQDRPTVKPFALPTLEECWAEFAQQGMLNSGKSFATPYEEARAEREADNTAQIIRKFLDRPVPVGWERWSLKNRLLYWRGGGSTTLTDHGLISKAAVQKRCILVAERDRVCAAEVWAEAFCHPPEDMTNKDARSINRIISTLPGWRETDGSIRFGPHGKCRGFVKSV